MRPSAWLSALLVLCSLTALAASRAHADAAPTTEAQQLFEQGTRLSAQERWLEAREAFTRSASLTPRASTYYNLAVCSLALGLGRATLEALARFEALAEDSVPPEQAKKAAALRSEAQALVGTLVLSLAPRDAQLDVDGQRQPTAALTDAERIVWLDPGVHVVRASAEGYTESSFELTVAAQATLHRRIELGKQPIADAPAPPAAVDLVVREPAHEPIAPLAKPEHVARAKPSSAEHDDASASLWSHPLTWVVLGVVAASVATVVVLTLPGDSPDSPYGGSAGYTL